MAEKAMFEFKKPGLSFLKKKKDVFGKGGAASGNKILRRDLKKTPTETRIFLKQSENLGI